MRPRCATAGVLTLLVEFWEDTIRTTRVFPFQPPLASVLPTALSTPAIRLLQAPLSWYSLPNHNKAMVSETVTAEIQYLKRLPLYRKEKPFQLFVPVAADTRSTNLEFEAKEHTFEDVRGREDIFSLDEHGFQFGVHPTKLDPELFGDRDAVETRYFDEVKEILREIEGGYDEIFLFDWRVGH